MFGVPISGASASLSASTAITGSDGTASVTTTANGIASLTAYTVSASVAGVTTPATFALTNTQAVTTLAVTPSAILLVYGQPVTISAAISPSNVDGSKPTGSVTFFDGTTTLASISMVSSAAASYTVIVPIVGSHTYSAQYLGDTNFEQSAQVSAASAVVVEKADVTLTGPATQPVTVPNGQAGSITITLSGQYSGSGIATPSESVSYTVSGSGFPPGTGAISGGKATIAVPATTTPGSYSVTVNYGGDANYAAAKAITVSLTVTPSAVSVIDNEAIAVSDAGIDVLPGDLSGDKEAITVADTVSVQLSAMVIDNEAISVDGGIDVLPGDLCGDNEAVSVADGVEIQVHGIVTSTKLAISPSLVSTDQSVTFTATTTQDVEAGAPTGTVTFSCAQPPLNSGSITLSAGSASWTTSSVPAGIYNNCITAAYSGDASHASSVSPPGSLTVINIRYGAPPPADVVLWPGHSTRFTFTLAPASVAFNGTVAFHMVGLPAGVTATFNPSAVTLGNSPVTVTVTLTATSLAQLEPPQRRLGPVVPIALVLLLPFLALGRIRRRICSAGWLTLVLLLSLIAVAGLGACGSFNQPPKTYTVTLTAASGTAQQSTTFDLTVE